MSHVVFPLTIVAVAIRVEESTFAVCFIVEPFSDVFAAVGPGFSAGSLVHAVLLEALE
jgi:hypothetical protein